MSALTMLPTGTWSSLAGTGAGKQNLQLCYSSMGEAERQGRGESCLWPGFLGCFGEDF